MKNVLKACSFCYLVLIALACEQDQDPVLNNVSVDDYFPNSTGSYWTYEGYINYTATITGQTEMFDGKLYQEIKNERTQGESSGYFRKESGVYYMRGAITSLDGTSVSDQLDLILAKENAAVGETWNLDVVVNGVETRYISTLEAIDLQVQVKRAGL